MMEFLSIQAQAVAANWITTLLTGTVRAIQDDAETQAIWNCLNLAQSEVPQDQEESLTYAFKTLGAKGMRCFINDVLSERPQTEISKVLERGGLDPKTLPGANAALQLFADSFVKALKNHAKNQNSPLFNRVSIANQERMLINQASQDQIILLRIDTAVQQILSQQSQEHFLSPDTVIQNWLNSSKPPEKLRKLMEQAIQPNSMRWRQMYGRRTKCLTKSRLSMLKL